MCRGVGEIVHAGTLYSVVCRAGLRHVRAAIYDDLFKVNAVLKISKISYCTLRPKQLSLPPPKFFSHSIFSLFVPTTHNFRGWINDKFLGIWFTKYWLAGTTRQACPPTSIIIGPYTRFFLSKAYRLQSLFPNIQPEYYRIVNFEKKLRGGGGSGILN